MQIVASMSKLRCCFLKLSGIFPPNSFHPHWVESVNVESAAAESKVVEG